MPEDIRFIDPDTNSTYQERFTARMAAFNQAHHPQEKTLDQIIAAAQQIERYLLTGDHLPATRELDNEEAHESVQ